MPVYVYKALGRSGQRVKDRFEARNEAELEARLQHMGLELIAARTQAAGSPVIGRMSRRDLLAFCFDLEQIVRAGLPLLDALSDLARASEHPPVRRMLTSLVAQIEGGKTLADALSSFPRIFNPVFVSLIRAGEHSGRMGEILENLGKALRWQDELITQTKKLLIYPAFVGVVVLAVSGFLLVYLVPQVVTLLQTMGSELPLQTRALIALSDFVVQFWWFCLLAPLALAAGIAALMRNRPGARHRLDLWTLRAPVVGTILRKLIVARFASSLALMYRSGISILDALRSCEDIVGNAAVARGVRRAAEEIRSGRRLSEGFASIDMFPPLVIRMLRMGENTGALDAALMNVNYFYERDVRESVDRALKLIEPMLTLVLGGMLAFILFAVLTPVYDVLGRVRF